ncbi:hypothetical protein GCM10009802_14450 [Streptomyces synnematoformans]|uniref:Uncharacterized protein n=1 Tax=Streptomyces synnematoformans TaxID=415721 RepID=A0ABP5JC64_9ACTN
MQRNTSVRALDGGDDVHERDPRERPGEPEAAARPGLGIQNYQRKQESCEAVDTYSRPSDIST